MQEKLEKLSVADGLRAVIFAEVVVLMFDALTPLEKQELALADLVFREGRALVLAANKWDLVVDRDETFRELREKVDRLLPQVPGVPIIRFSTKTGLGVNGLMPAVTRVYRDWNARVKTPDLNDWREEATGRHPPPAVSGRRIKFRYIAQTKTRPPTFVVQCSRADAVPESYKRYLINSIRESICNTGCADPVDSQKAGKSVRE